MTKIHKKLEVNISSNTYLSVSILNADIQSDHEEDSDGDTEVSNQTTDLVRVIYSLFKITVTYVMGILLILLQILVK